MKRLLSWFFKRRKQKRLALIAETASLVIQQHGQQWSNRKCPNCLQAISETVNFCPMCGHSFVAELQIAPEQSVQQLYEIERHTSSMHPIVVPKRPLLSARQVHQQKVSTIATSEVTVPTDLQQLMRKGMKRER